MFFVGHSLWSGFFILAETCASGHIQREATRVSQVETSSVVRIGLLGCGVVGGGVVEALSVHRKRIEEACGAKIEITHIAVKDLHRSRNPHVSTELLCDDWDAVCRADDVDVIIEAMGGQSAAKSALLAALSHGKHVVTANKELLAEHGLSLVDAASEKGLQLQCEASVLGGIPAIHNLTTYFRANRIRKIRGIVNGTCNYILTQMYERSTPLTEALAEAQVHGYAEPDPAFDIEGRDPYFKLRILATEVSGSWSDEVLIGAPKGILEITEAEVAAAKDAGAKIKHVVTAEWDEDGNLQRAAVAPVWVTADDPLFGVDGVQNALCITGDIVGDILLVGPGAGALPTASAILEDLAKVCQTAILPARVLASKAG